MVAPEVRIEPVAGVELQIEPVAVAVAVAEIDPQTDPVAEGEAGSLDEPAAHTGSAPCSAQVSAAREPSCCNHPRSAPGDWKTPSHS